jgi:hypothetical protein
MSFLFNFIVTYSSDSTYGFVNMMFPLFAISSPSSAVRKLVTRVYFDEKSGVSTQQIASIIRNCFRLESLSVKNCPAFSVPDLVAILCSEEDEKYDFSPLCELELEPPDIFSISKDDSLEWAVALKKLEQFFDFDSSTSICGCGGFLPLFPYIISCLIKDLVTKNGVRNVVIQCRVFATTAKMIEGWYSARVKNVTFDRAAIRLNAPSARNGLSKNAKVVIS